MKPADLIVNGEIVLEGDVVPSGFEDYFDGGIITANLFRRALAMVDGDVVVRVNSAGGDPTEGEAIRAAIADHGAPVTVKVAGDAMSAASLMIMAADTIEMSPGSIMMIHDPSALTLGTSEDHRKSADVLDILADTYAGVYARRSGKSAAEMRTLMKSELYMGPAEAIAQGFADAISGDADDDDRDPAPELAAAEMSAARTRHAASITMVKRALVQHRPHNNSNPTAAGVTTRPSWPQPRRQQCLIPQNRRKRRPNPKPRPPCKWPRRMRRRRKRFNPPSWQSVPAQRTSGKWRRPSWPPASCRRTMSTRLSRMARARMPPASGSWP